jgi:hypothetical protein
VSCLCGRADIARRSLQAIREEISAVSRASGARLKHVTDELRSLRCHFRGSLRLAGSTGLRQFVIMRHRHAFFSVNRGVCRCGRWAASAACGVPPLSPADAAAMGIL